MLIAAVAVSVASVPVEPLDSAFENRVLQVVEVGPDALVQELRIFAKVLIVALGTMPRPPMVVERAAPLDVSTRLPALKKAFATPVSASELPELDT